LKKNIKREEDNLDKKTCKTKRKEGGTENKYWEKKGKKNKTKINDKTDKKTKMKKKHVKKL
jgi:hypothetical protein